VPAGLPSRTHGAGHLLIDFEFSIVVMSIFLKQQGVGGDVLLHSFPDPCGDPDNETCRS
jgi:hypothetical protein